MALAAKVSPLVIGLTVVALGTSAPELAVSLQACLEGDATKTDMAIGNAVGSNLANILFILGVSALATPLVVNSRLFKLDVPVMIGAAIALWLLGMDGSLSRVEGSVLCVVLVVYLVWTVWQGRREERILAAEIDMPAEAPISAKFVVLSCIYLAIGLALLVYGADWLVGGCVELAKKAGVSELVISLTVIAIGTSLPELVTSVMAAVRGKRDLAVGNVVGSNILNILCVLGFSSAVAPNGINVDLEATLFHIPVMLAVSLLCLPIFFTGLAISRAEGAAMLLYYLAYLGVLVWAKTSTPMVEASVTYTLIFLAPLPVILGLSLLSARRA